MARVITVTSGKGGVGKTNLSVNLAVRLARDGYRTCIFDADLGLANINILLGMSPEYNLEDVVTGEKTVPDILVQDPSGVHIVPGGTGVEMLVDLPPERLSGLIKSFSCLQGYDFLFFDTSAGISRDVLSFCMASTEVVLVVIPEPTSLTDGYSLLKVLSMNGYKEPVTVVVNRAKNERYAKAVFDKFSETVKKFLPLEITYAGCLPSDEGVAEAVARQRPFVDLYPNGRAANGITRLARHLADTADPGSTPGALDTFWERYSKFVQGPVQIPNEKPRRKPKDADAESPAPKAPAPPPPPKEQSKQPTQPAQPAASTTPADDPITHQILNSLNRLVTATTDISRELSEFRKVLGTTDPANAAGTGPVSPEADAQLPPVIALDFEAYVERKKTRQKKNDGR